MLNDQEFLRYSRQLLLEDVGPEGGRGSSAPRC